MERNMAKVGWCFAAFVLVSIAIVTLTPKPKTALLDCSIDWDGRANSEVCQ